jgi:hypothetical protein
MKKLAELVNDFPARIVSRMTPKGTGRQGSSLMRLEHNVRRQKLPGEVSQSVYFGGYELRFGSEIGPDNMGQDKNKAWVRIEPYADVLREYDVDALQGALKDPRSLSKSPIHNLYAGVFGKGVVSEEEGAVYVKFTYGEQKKGSTAAFDGFWYKFRPILKVINEGKPI